ncbi:CBS domain protein [Candidatus Methanoperedenaceae archaeon GB50]|nr:CBS domain protein [Candidatus Methanoperedenaceae archaeon GB37]CAD7774872.1 CBS domain protein [Candidatus Methanoperedenaceae archaeon GB50]CAD7780313.1 MAG: CBS domain protein [Candidatus Methanoperedenaceae archaeon GB50]
MLPTPKDIKERRLALHMTQNELAKRAGVSQPLIARIESGDIDPRLSTLQKIFNAFESAERERVIAADIMHSSVVHVRPTDTVEYAVSLMEEEDFSQVPVLDNGVPVGSISSDTVVHQIVEKRKGDIGSMLVKEIMESPFPSVSLTTDVDTIFHILEKHPAVLVVDHGEVTGVVTQHDIIQLVHRRRNKGSHEEA